MSLDLTILVESGQFVCLREYPGYGVSADGRVWSCRFSGGRYTGERIGNEWRELKSVLVNGYLQVAFQRSIGRQKKSVHRLVLEAFVGPCPPGMLACHFDDVRTNNHLHNLRWDTPKNNIRDAARNGRQPEDWALGSRSSAAKLHETDIPEIRRLLQQGLSQECVGKMFGLTQSGISLIARGRNWKHV